MTPIMSAHRGHGSRRRSSAAAASATVELQRWAVAARPQRDKSSCALRRRQSPEIRPPMPRSRRRQAAIALEGGSRCPTFEKGFDETDRGKDVRMVSVQESGASVSLGLTGPADKHNRAADVSACGDDQGRRRPVRGRNRPPRGGTAWDVRRESAFFFARARSSALRARMSAILCPCGTSSGFATRAW